MIFGVPKERKPGEWRVALPPAAVGQLTQKGLTVLVEKNAGLGAGWHDRDYRETGAHLTTAADLYRRAGLVVKVKEPQPSEYRLLRPGLILFTFLHLAADRSLQRELVQRKVKAIPYESVLGEKGDLSILAPMSEIAGQLAVLIGANILRKDLGGKGTLISSSAGGRLGHVTVIGAGHVGSQAVRVAQGMGAMVSVYDIDREKLQRIQSPYRERIEIFSERRDLPAVIRRTDLLIGAVLVPGRRTPTIVTREMVRSMEAGSVVIDVAVDQGGCVETIRPTTLKNPVYERYGVLHYGVTNIPSLVPRTATEALSAVTLPYLLRIAALGVDRAVKLVEEA